MIPGVQSKITEDTVASATTIVAKADLIRITGSTQIETITSQLLINRGGVIIFLTPVDGAVVLGTSGNILVGQNPMAQNRLYMLIYSAFAAKWYVHAVA